MRKIIDAFGNTGYYNDNNKLHREDGPAVIFKNGYEAWYLNGLLHREDGPAKGKNGTNEWWYKGRRIMITRDEVTPEQIQEFKLKALT